MMMQATLEKLRELRLRGMALALEEQMRDPRTSDLSFEERLSILVDREQTDRHNSRYHRKVQEAKFKENALFEDIDWHHSRKLDKSVVMSLVGLDWIRRHQHIVILGKTGAGKTWLACALGHRACLEDFRVRFYRMPQFFDEVSTAKADGGFFRFLARLKKVDVLIFDNWGQTFSEEERRDFFEVIEDRTGSGSLIITSQLPVEAWPEVIGDPTDADSIMDRIIHSSHIITVQGESQRKKRSEIRRKEAEKDPADSDRACKSGR